MGNSLNEIAKQLKDKNKKAQLIYAFNGNGKTRLSREFRYLIAPKNDAEEETELGRKKILYYNAFTEDLLYWDNDSEGDSEPKLNIHPNSFTDWIFNEQGQDQNIVTNFQHYTNEKLTPHFNQNYINSEGKIVNAFTKVTFSYKRGNNEISENIKISKGEESNFIWSIFYTLIEQVVGVLNTPEPDNRETDQFNELKYIFIDDPVSSLDDNHLIQLAVDLAELIKKSSQSKLKFIITTHNPLFYNVLSNELGRRDKYYSYNGNKHFLKYRLEKLEDGTFLLPIQPNDSPFSYHLFLKTEIKKAIETGEVKKYHFNFLRNILEKISTFLGYNDWVDLLPVSIDGRPNPYEKRILNLSSHSKHSGDEIVELTNNDKLVLDFLMKNIEALKLFK